MPQFRRAVLLLLVKFGPEYFGGRIIHDSTQSLVPIEEEPNASQLRTSRPLKSRLLFCPYREPMRLLLPFSFLCAGLCSSYYFHIGVLSLDLDRCC